MTVTCENKFQTQHLTILKTLIPLCKYTSDRWNFNLWGIIAVIYHIYIESGLYNLLYGKNQVWVYKIIFIKQTMSNWKDHYSFTRFVIV